MTSTILHPTQRGVKENPTRKRRLLHRSNEAVRYLFPWNSPHRSGTHLQQHRHRDVSFVVTLIPQQGEATTPHHPLHLHQKPRVDVVVSPLHLLCDYTGSLNILETYNAFFFSQKYYLCNPTAIDTASLSRSVMYISSSLSFTFCSLNVAIILFTVGIVNSIFFKS